MLAFTGTAVTSVRIPVTNGVLNGDLSIPENAVAVIVFAHGSGSSRFSPRNKLIAQIMQKNGFATLLMDLLTTEEESIDEHTRAYRFDIILLAKRLIQCSEWLDKFTTTQFLNIGFFGASTGAAAALVAAASLGDRVGAVVSRGGRPDLAGKALLQVQAPTLLIVGSLDTDVITLNRKAQMQLTGVNRLEIVPGASHLFPEPGALEKAGELASKWFQRYLLTN